MLCWYENDFYIFDIGEKGYQTCGFAQKFYMIDENV